MSRKREGWIKLSAAKNEREKPTDPKPGEGGSRSADPEEKKHFVKRKLRQKGVPQEGGHSQASFGEQENKPNEGGHSQSSNGVNPHRSIILDGGHNQSSTGKQQHYGHFGRYNDQIDFPG
jgi:hypothetical protein